MHTVLELIASVVKSTVQADKSREYWAVTGTLAVIGGWCANLLGGWDAAVQTYFVFMGLDILLGLTLAVLKRSKKSESGGLNSFSFWKGISRKFVSLVFIAGATAMDRFLGMHFVREAVVISYIVGEAISLAENATILGAPVPEKWRQVIDILAKKSNESGTKGGGNNGT